MAASLVGKGLGSNMTTAAGTTAAGDVLLFFSSQIWPGSGSFSIKDQIGGVDTGNTWTLLSDVYTPLYGHGNCVWKCTSGSRGANHRVVITDDGRTGAVGFFVRVPNASDVDVVVANTTTSAVATGTLAQANEEVLLFGCDSNPGSTPSWSTTLAGASKLAEETDYVTYIAAVLYTSTVASTASVSGNISPSAYPAKTILGVKLSAGGGTAITGVSATGAAGTVGVTHSNALTGTQATGAAGNVTPTLSKALTGNSATSAVGTVAPALSKSLTGIQAIGSAGTVVPNITVALTGVQATGQVGTLTPTTGATAALSGVAATGSVGNVTPNISVALTGVQASGQVGTVAPQSGVTAALTGVQAAGAVGNVTPTITVALTGVQASGQVGSIAFASRDVSVALTGVWGVGLAGNVTPVGGDAPVVGGFPGFEVVQRRAPRPRMLQERSIQPILERMLAKKLPKVKPASERAAKRAKRIEEEAARLLLDDASDTAVLEKLEEWEAQEPYVPPRLADIPPLDLFLAQVAFRIEQMHEQDAIIRKRRQDEDTLFALMLA